MNQGYSFLKRLICVKVWMKTYNKKKYTFYLIYAIVRVKCDKPLWWIRNVYDYANVGEIYYMHEFLQWACFPWNSFDYFK